MATDAHQYSSEYDQTYGADVGAEYPVGPPTGEVPVVESAPIVKAQRQPRVKGSWTTTALIVIAVVAIILGPSLVWLVSVTIRPNEVGAIPQISEAVTIAAVSGLLGIIVGRQSRDGEGPARDRA